VSVTLPIIAGSPSGGSVGIVGWYIPPATGSVSVASISFNAVGGIGDSTTIDVSVNSLGDKDGNPISYTTQGATVEIVEPPPVQYDLTISSTTGGSVTTPGEGTFSYDAGEEVSLVASPAAGYQFVNWTGDVANPNSATTTVTMDSDKTITAKFEPPPSPPPPGQYSLTIEVEGQGTTVPPVGSHNYDEGSEVEVTAIPEEGWQFDGWTGDVADTNSATTTITLDADETIVAKFVPEADITPPAILAMVAVNITKTSADINWITNEPADSQVEYWSIPVEMTPLDERLVTEHNVQLTGLMPATEYHYKVWTRDEAGNLTVSEEDSFTTLGIPATFEISDWDITMAKLEVGERATITFIITNIGDLAGSHQVDLIVGRQHFRLL